MNQKYMDAVVATGTLGLGVGVAVTQLGLFVGTAATNLVLDCIIITKNTGKEAMNKGVSIEKAIEERIYNAIGAGQELAKNPTEKLTEHANTFLDIANSVTDNIFGFPKAVEDPESSLKERVTFLAGRIAGGLKVRTNEFVIDPLTQQINAVVEQFGKCLVLVDYLKQRQEWTYTKVGQLSTSMSELRNTIEVGAKNPSECLLGLIRLYSSRLNEQLVKLRERGAELLSASMQKQVQAATMYVQHLDETLANAQSIDEVKQEVFVEAKQKVTEIAQWSNSILLSTNKQPKKEQNATMDN